MHYHHVTIATCAFKFKFTFYLLYPGNIDTSVKSAYTVRSPYLYHQNDTMKFFSSERLSIAHKVTLWDKTYINKHVQFAQWLCNIHCVMSQQFSSLMAWGCRHGDGVRQNYKNVSEFQRKEETTGEEKQRDQRENVTFMFQPRSRWPRSSPDVQQRQQWAIPHTLPR